MPRQRIQDQWSRSCENGIFIPKGKERAYASALATFTSDFDGEADQGLENVGVIFRDLAEILFEHSIGSIFSKKCRID